MNGCVKTFKVKDGNKDNKLISFCINYEKPLEKYKTSCTKIADLKNIKLNALFVYDDRYIGTKSRMYKDKYYADFSGLNVPEDGAACESFTTICIGSLLVHENKYYLQVYLDICVDKIVNTEMVDYLEYNIFDV